MGVFDAEIAAQDPDRRAHGHDRARRALQLLGVLRRQGLDAADDRFADTEIRVTVLRNTTPEQFLDILTYENHLFLGQQPGRWQGQPASVEVGSLGMGTDVQPPDQADHELLRLLAQLRVDLQPATKDVWAAKLCIGIVFAHLFPDGNGRLARNAYSFVKDGRLLPKERSIKQQGQQFSHMCRSINQAAIYQLFVQAGIASDSDSTFRVSDYEVVDTHGQEQFAHGLCNSLQFVAATQVGLVEPGTHFAFKDDWSQEERHRFDVAYQRTRVEWFWAAQDVIDVHPDWAVAGLDNSLGLSDEQDQ